MKSYKELSKILRSIKSSKTPEQLAKKYGVSVKFIQKQLNKGHKIEKEHTTNNRLALTIAAQHVDEIPNYYDKLETIESPMSESYTRLQKTGNTYHILFTWRGIPRTLQIFVSGFSRPTKAEMSHQINKIYPEARVLKFSPSEHDPTKPLFLYGDT